MNIKEFRQKYPQYADVSDGDLAQSMHKKFYADMPYEKFEASFIGHSPVKLGAEAFPDTLKQVLQGSSWGDRNLAAFGSTPVQLWEGAKQLVGQSNQENVRNQRVIRNEAPIGAFAGDAATLALPFGLVGNSVRGAAAVGGAYGLASPVETDNPLEAIKGKAISTGVGALAAGGGQAVANKLLGATKGKLSAIEQKIQDKAAQVAASETASARSAAGNAAQNAYRQLEHLRALGANRALTPDELLTVKALERELAEKALEKLLPAAELKQATSQAYKDAMRTEADRAAAYAAEKLSGDEVKRQFMARLKRYGPAVAGGVVGNMIFPGLGGSVGGAATGLVLRPAIRSTMNLAKNPTVQHSILSPLSHSPLFTTPSIPVGSTLAAEGILNELQDRRSLLLSGPFERQPK